jgi:hypothetical protein
MNQAVAENIEDILDKKLKMVYQDFSVKEKLTNALRLLENCPDLDFDFRQFLVSLKIHIKEYDYNINLDSIISLETLKEVLNSLNKAIRNNGVWQVKKCLACGESFKLTYEEVLFFEENNFPPPKRCRNCRKERKVKH